MKATPNTISEALFDHAAEGILVVNSEGDIGAINPAAEQMFGYKPEELLGEKVERLIPKSLSGNHKRHREKYIKNPHSRTMGIGIELFGQKKDGTEFPVEVSLSPFEEGGERFVIAFVIDITIRKRQDEFLQKAHQELQNHIDQINSLNAELEKRVKDRTLVLEEAIEQLSKTKEDLRVALEKEKELNNLKTRFVSMASHEFRTPLSAVLSSLSLVEKYDELGETEKKKKHINRIKTSVQNLTEILNDMLSLSKLEEGKVPLKLEGLDFKEMMQQIVSDMQEIAKLGQTINCKHEGEKKVLMDKKILRHILSNLISNAIKFSPENKSVDVHCSVDEHIMNISVADQGLGIPSEDQKHLFNRFFRAQNASNIQGTGLGLNIVAKYVELLGGKIDFVSELEKGTTFTIQLPVNEEVID